MTSYQIAPSLLAAHFAKLGEEAQAVLKAGADLLHLDVMDNHYVPNLTVGPMVCSALRHYGITAPIDVHLMTRPVDRLIAEFAEAGASSLIIHPDGTDHLDRSLSLIKKHGCEVGIALNPATPLNALEYILDQLDIILIMSVNPGFGGQSFIPTALKKIKDVRALIDREKPTITLGVDGGVNLKNIREIASAGANRLIAGSAIFGEPDYATIISKMRNELAQIA
jgi:ribulose-phosphate 3-epimerase